MFDHARREKHRPAAGKLGVVHPPAAQDLVLERPGERRFGIFLDVTRQHGVAPAADGDVQRGTWPSRIRQRSGKPHLLDESLGVEHGLDLTRVLASPPGIAVSSMSLRSSGRGFMMKKWPGRDAKQGPCRARD